LRNVVGLRLKGLADLGLGSYVCRSLWEAFRATHTTRDAQEEIMAGAPKPKSSMSDSRHDEEVAAERGDNIASGVFKIKRLASGMKKVMQVVRTDAERLAKQQDEIDRETKKVAQCVREESEAPAATPSPRASR
jgi:hypothetical protein